jgi:hypothetical protein
VYNLLSLQVSVDDRSSSRSATNTTNGDRTELHDEMIITNVVEELMTDVCLKLRIDMNENQTPPPHETPLRNTSGASLSNQQVVFYTFTDCLL